MKKNLLKISIYFICLIIVYPAIADSIFVDFENPPYATGTINNQDGWISSGPYDQAVTANTYGYEKFSSQSFRISDAITSGSFGDQTFSKPLINSVGETSATAGSFPEGTRQSHFEMQFDIASTQQTQQPGMHITVSPDRGDGSRMSYLRFEDGTTGIDVFFVDVEGTSNPANFVETKIATGLSRTVPHTIKLTLDVIDKPSNDIVKVYIDGSLITTNNNSCITGTSWENYYRYDSESSAEQSPRIVRTVLFRASSPTNTSDLGKGFLFDNLSLLSGPTGPLTPQGCDISSSPIPTISEWALIILSVVMAVTIGLTARVRHS